MPNENFKVGDLCVIWLPGSKKQKLESKKICVIIKIYDDDSIDILKPEQGIMTLPIHWVKRVNDDGAFWE